jgi:hypothetical protein
MKNAASLDVTLWSVGMYVRHGVGVAVAPVRGRFDPSKCLLLPIMFTVAGLKMERTTQFIIIPTGRASCLVAASEPKQEIPFDC